jgi:hypothetical protein
MKTFVLLCISIIAFLHAEEPPVVFQVSKVGDDKSELNRVFERIKIGEDLILRKNAHISSRVYEVSQKIDELSCLAYGCIGPIRSLSGATYGEYNVDTSVVFYIIATKKRNLADGEKIKDMLSVATDQTKDYMSVIGAKVTARIVKEIDEKDIPVFTKDNFVEALKGGKTWTLQSFSETDCVDCFGKGKLGALKNYKPCERCHGKGKLTRDCLVKW